MSRKESYAKHQKKKSKQLGMSYGTAAHRLRKLILFNLLRQFNLNLCYQCGMCIDNHEELSVEHKIPWLNSNDPPGLFFDLENIAFSHLTCNIKAGNHSRDHLKKHPSMSAYDRGCRCDECREFNKKRCRDYKQRLKEPNDATASTKEEIEETFNDKA